ncbi:DeoR/GlpR family DNA-binding transcription regulator [Lysobacter tyrosinilyticus]
MGEDRRRRIVAWINERGSATVNEMAHEFGVSTVTLRADLQALEESGALERSHGGALPVASRETPITEAPLSVKRARYHDEKVDIARVAAAMIRDGETIILDSGSTTFEIARLLGQLPLRSLTVVTNALNIATELVDGPSHIRVLMLGGVLRPLSYSMVGPDAELTLSRIVADRLFLGADAVDPELGVTTADPTEAQLNSRMVEVARETIVLADASKFGRRSFSRIAPLEAVHCIVTDRKAPRELVAAFRKRGVEVQLA